MANPVNIQAKTLMGRSGGWQNEGISAPGRSTHSYDPLRNYRI